MTAEEWRRVRGKPEFAVSNLGRVKHVFPGPKSPPGRIIKPFIGSHGYPVVHLRSMWGDTRRFLVHRLVCEAFHGRAPFAKAEVAHGDGVRTNARADNLRWATRKENMADCVLHGTRATGPRHGRSTKPHRTPRGDIHGHAKLTAAAVHEIRFAPQTEGSGRRLAEKFGVTPGTICMIRKRRTWTHL